MSNHLKKPELKHIAIFGAAGRMGKEVANYLSYLDPGIKLRLLTSSEETAATLRESYPSAEVRIANYLDKASLAPALQGVDGVFVVTPPGFDEKTGMSNLVEALGEVDSLVQIIRLVGYVPEFPRNKFPWDRLKTGGAHFIAKEILDESGLPVTYVNLAAALMDNLFFCMGGIRQSRKLIWPDRCTPVMDIRDLGEVIARLFLNSDARYIGSLVTLNNGYDLPTTEETAQMMSDAFLTPIACETSREAFIDHFGPLFQKRYGSADRAGVLLDSFEWEHNTCLWELNTTAERILGRRPNTLHSWLQEHKPLFMAPAQ